MNQALRGLFAQVIVGSALVCGQGANRAQLPDAPGRDTVKRICSACHPAEVVLGKGMSRDQWGTMVSNMVSRGARGTDEEFAQVVDYLTKNLPPEKPGPVTTGPGMTSTTSAAPSAVPTPKRRPSLIDQAGASDKHVVDEEAANRGRTIYIAQCITCHGPKARGTDRGPDMVRSLVVLKDRYGSLIGPFLKKGHPMQSGEASSSLTKQQVDDLSHFLHQKVGDTLRTGPYNTVLNVLVGDAKAGQNYFNGAGKCSTCHSPIGRFGRHCDQI